MNTSSRHLLSFVASLLLSAGVFIPVLTAADALPTISSVETRPAAATVTAKNTSQCGFVITGTNLATVTTCRLAIDPQRNQFHPLNIQFTKANQVYATLPAATKARPPLAPGQYRLHVGNAAGQTIWNGWVTITGVAVLAFDPSSMNHQQMQLLITCSDRTDVQAIQLRDARGDLWPATNFKPYHVDANVLLANWGPVPAGEYTIVLFGAGDIELAKSATKFRAIANPTN